LGKAICDALNGIAYKDDSQIVDGRVRKFFCEKNGTARTEIEIY